MFKTANAFFRKHSALLQKVGVQIESTTWFDSDGHEVVRRLIKNARGVKRNQSKAFKLFSECEYCETSFYLGIIYEGGK